MNKERQSDEPENPYVSPQPFVQLESSRLEDPETRELRAFVGSKADYYLRKWAPLRGARGDGSGFNWAAFFLTGLWLPYRKMYKATGIFYGIIVLEGILQHSVAIAGERVGGGRPRLIVGLAVWILGGFTAIVHAQPSPPRPQTGWYGGPYKVVAADFTGDQKVDLAVAYTVDAVTLEQGDGQGSFARLALFPIPFENRQTIEGVHNLAQEDIDGDGLPDLAMAVGSGSPGSMDGRIVLAKNMGQGRFEKALEFPTESLAKGVRWVDLDHDGRLDLAYTARGSGYEGDTAIGKLTIRQGLGEWKFGPALDFEAGRSAYYVETGDLDNDGFLDILVPNEHADSVIYWINPGREIFTNPQALSPHVVHVGKRLEGERSAGVNDVRAADVNGDGKLDIVTANLGPSTISIFSGNGDGSFQKDTLLDGGKDCAFLGVGDLNGDGKLDIIVTHWTGDFMSVFVNEGNGGFLPRADYKTGLGNYGVTLCDLNSDGKLDAVTANYRERSFSVLLGVGDGTFKPAVTTPSGLHLVHGKWVEERK